MTHKLDFAIVGGDSRHVRLAEALSADGHRVFVYALEKAKFSEDIIREKHFDSLSKSVDCVVLPIPIKSSNGLLNTPFSDKEYDVNSLFPLFATGQTVIGGKIGNDLFELAGRCGIHLFDCLEREDFTVLNSVPTAEGAIAVAMSERERTLNGAKCLVLGFGHIGKLLCAYLKGLGAHVTASARKSGDLAWISAYGYLPIKTDDIKKILPEADVIFNTIPSKILDRDTLSVIKKGAFICDLASSPGGVDFKVADELGIRTCHALSLPGKVAPATAAESLRNTIYNILKEWGK